MRVGSLPLIYPPDFYLRALLPRRMGGRPIYESVALCEHYDPELVLYYLNARASAAHVRGDDPKAAHITTLADKVCRQWQSRVTRPGD